MTALRDALVDWAIRRLTADDDRSMPPVDPTTITVEWAAPVSGIDADVVIKISARRTWKGGIVYTTVHDLTLGQFIDELETYVEPW